MVSEREDPLAYLPCSEIDKFPRGDTIYSPVKPSDRIYLIITGRVTVFRIGASGDRTVIDVYGADNFFGQSSLAGAVKLRETAVAFENTEVMTWTATEIEKRTLQQPRLAVAFLQVLVQHTVDLHWRLENLARERSDRRLARLLLHLGERLGQECADGLTQIPPLTHALLASYEGTTREVISGFMAEFRRRGLIRYSRNAIEVYSEGLRDWLRRGGLNTNRCSAS